MEIWKEKEDKRPGSEIKASWNKGCKTNLKTYLVNKKEQDNSVTSVLTFAKLSILINFISSWQFVFGTLFPLLNQWQAKDSLKEALATACFITCSTMKNRYWSADKNKIELQWTHIWQQSNSKHWWQYLTQLDTTAPANRKHNKRCLNLK